MISGSLFVWMAILVHMLDCRLLFLLFLDRKWYRGTVMVTKSSTKAFILFVDYGNRELKGLEDLRLMDRKWLAVPRGCLLMLDNSKWRSAVLAYGLMNQAASDCSTDCELSKPTFLRRVVFLKSRSHLPCTLHLPFQVDFWSRRIKPLGSSGRISGVTVAHVLLISAILLFDVNYSPFYAVQQFYKKPWSKNTERPDAFLEH